MIEVFRRQVRKQPRKGRQSTEKCDGEAKQRTPLKSEGTQRDERIEGGHGLVTSLFWANCNAYITHLRLSLESLGDIPRDPPVDPPTSKIDVAKSMLSLFGQLLVTLEVPMDSTSPRNPSLNGVL